MVAVETVWLLWVDIPRSTALSSFDAFCAFFSSCLVAPPGLGHGINAIRPCWCVQQVREFLASLGI